MLQQLRQLFLSPNLRADQAGFGWFVSPLVFPKKPSNPAFKFLPFSDEWDDSDPDDIWEFWILICFHR
ncbi:hypothetical protein ACFX2K_041768 [Malus domestica]